MLYAFFWVITQNSAYSNPDVDSCPFAATRCFPLLHLKRHRTANEFILTAAVRQLSNYNTHSNAKSEVSNKH